MAVTGIVSGINADITFAGGYVVKTSAWTIDASAGVIDTTALGDDWRTKIGGLKDWSGTFSCIVDSSSLRSLEGLALGVAPSAAVFIFDEEATTDGSFGGTILIESFSVAPSVGDTPTTITFNYQGSGALSVTAAA